MRKKNMEKTENFDPEEGDKKPAKTVSGTPCPYC